MDQEDTIAEGVFNGPPYNGCQLKKLALLLRGLKHGDYVLPEASFVNGLPQPLVGFISESACRYRSASACSIEIDSSEAEAVRKELNALRRSIKRSPDDPVKAFNRVGQLSVPAVRLLAFAAGSKREEWAPLIDSMKRAKRAWNVFCDCADKAPRFLDSPRGPSEDEALLNFAVRLIRIYVEETGRAIGRGYQYEPAEYEAPLERFLMAAIKPVRPHTTIDSVRGLIRKLQKIKNYQ